MKRASLQSIGIIACLCLTGCFDSIIVRNDYKAALTTFNSSVVSASAAIDALYGEMNSYEADLYFLKAAYSPGVKLAATDSRGPTVINEAYKPPFSVADIKKVTAIVDALGVFSQNLLDLTDPSNGAKDEAQFTAIGQNISSVATDLNNLAPQLNASAVTSKYTPYIGPLTTLFGNIAQIVQERRSQAAIVKAISDSNEAIPKVIDAIDAQFREFILAPHISGAESLVRKMIVDYDTYTQDPGAQTEVLLLKAQAIEKQIVIRNSYLNGAPTKITSGLKDSFAKLVAYIKSTEKTPTTVQGLIKSLQSLKGDSDSIISSVQAIRAVKATP